MLLQLEVAHFAMEIAKEDQFSYFYSSTSKEKKFRNPSIGKSLVTRMLLQPERSHTCPNCAKCAKCLKNLQLLRLSNHGKKWQLVFSSW